MLPSMLAILARAALVLAAGAAAGAAMRIAAHLALAVELVAIAAVSLARLPLPAGPLDTALLLAIPALSAWGAMVILGGRSPLAAAEELLPALVLGAAAAARLPAADAYDVAHLGACAYQVRAAAAWLRTGQRSLVAASALVLAAGDVALVLAAPAVARCGWPAAQVQGIAILGVVVWLEVTAARRGDP